MLVVQAPRMDVRLFILLFLASFSYQHINAERLKLCVVESVHTSKRINKLCPQLVTPGSQVECVIGNDRFNCLRRLIMGNADFTVLEPEDLVAASAYREYNILVTNELRLFPDEKQRYEMVVLVRKDIKNIWDIKGKSFCHPGLETTDDWSNAFSTYFENWRIPKECDPRKTLLENRMHSLSNFFQTACIAGSWAADFVFDSKLKSKYRNLCAACSNPVDCYSSDKYHGREGALLCLTDNAGDIAWVRLNDTLEHFKDEQINKDDYNYLCPDDTTRSVKFDKPCVWITKPWPVIVARSEIAEKVEKLMNSLNIVKLGWMIRDLLEEYHPTPVSTDTLETPKDFLVRFPGFMSANNRATCSPSRRVRWCIASNLEDKKCQTLRDASIVYGIKPAISCIQESSRASCLKALKTELADIFVARPEELYETRKMGLKTIVQATPKKNNEFIRIAAVVKQDSRFKSLKDLKGAKACFTGYRDVVWNALIPILKNISNSKSYCSDVNMVGNFFEKSYIIGLDSTHEEMPDNLYPVPKSANKNGNDIGVYYCMKNGLGDVAFVNLRSIEEATGNSTDRTKKKTYRTLCFNETNNDEECLLAWASPSVVIAHENMTDLRREEISTMLLEMDKLFGYTFKGQTPAFSMYGIYDANRSIIFPEGTQHLKIEVHKIQGIEQSYSDIIDDIVKQQKYCSNAERLNFHHRNTILIFVLFVIFSKWLNT